MSLPWGAGGGTQQFPRLPTLGRVALKRCWGGEWLHLSAIFWARGILGAPSGPVGSGAPDEAAQPLRAPGNRAGVRAREALRGSVGGRAGCRTPPRPGGRSPAGRETTPAARRPVEARGAAGLSVEMRSTMLDRQSRLDTAALFPGRGFCAGRGRLVCGGA